MKASFLVIPLYFVSSSMYVSVFSDCLNVYSCKRINKRAIGAKYGIKLSMNAVTTNKIKIKNWRLVITALLFVC